MRLDSGTIPEQDESGSASPSAISRKKGLKIKPYNKKDNLIHNLVDSPTSPKKRSKRLEQQLELPNAFIWERELRKSKNYEDYAKGTPDHAHLKANQSYTVRRRAKLTYDHQKKTQHAEFTKVFQELSKRKNKEEKDDEEEKKQVKQHQSVKEMLDAKFLAVNKKN